MPSGEGGEDLAVQLSGRMSLESQRERGEGGASVPPPQPRIRKAGREA